MAKSKKVKIEFDGSSDGVDAALKKASKSIKDFRQNTNNELGKSKGFMDSLMAGARSTQMERRKSGEMALERIAGRGIGGMAEFGLEAMGFGAAGLAIGIVGEQADKFAESLLKLKNGEATPADLAKGFMEGLPVLGSWVKASENLFEYFTGCRMETTEMVKMHEKLSQSIASQTQAAKGTYLGTMDPALGTAYSAHSKALAGYQQIEKEREEMRKAKLTPSAQDEKNWNERRFAISSEEKLTTSDAWRKYEMEKNKSSLALSQEFAQEKLTIEKNGAKSAGALWKVQEKEINAGFNAKYDAMDAEAINLRNKIKDIDEQLSVSDPNANSTKRLKQVRDDMDKQQRDIQRNMNALRAVNQSNITGPVTPLVPEMNFMILCLPANYTGSDKTWDWQRANYDASNKKLVSDGSDVNASNMGRAVSLATSGTCLMMRACDTNGQPVNVMVGIPNGNTSWMLWQMLKDPNTNTLYQGWGPLRMHDNNLP